MSKSHHSAIHFKNILSSFDVVPNTFVNNKKKNISTDSVSLEKIDENAVSSKLIIDKIIESFSIPNCQAIYFNMYEMENDIVQEEEVNKKVVDLNRLSETLETYKSILGQLTTKAKMTNPRKDVEQILKYIRSEVNNCCTEDFVVIDPRFLIHSRCNIKLYELNQIVKKKILNGYYPVILDLCGGPGAFSAEICRRCPNSTVVGVTLRTDNGCTSDWATTVCDYDKKIKYMNNFLYFGSSKVNGDITHPLFFEEFDSFMNQSCEFKFSDLVISDGAHDFKHSQEIENVLLILSEVLIALKYLSYHGTFILKTFSYTTRIMQDLLSWCSVLFTSTQIVKLKSSRISNSEFYFIFDRFVINNSPQITDKSKSIYLLYNDFVCLLESLRNKYMALKDDPELSRKINLEQLTIPNAKKNYTFLDIALNFLKDNLNIQQKAILHMRLKFARSFGLEDPLPADVRYLSQEEMDTVNQLEIIDKFRDAVTKKRRSDTAFLLQQIGLKVRQKY